MECRYLGRSVRFKIVYVFFIFKKIFSCKYNNKQKYSALTEDKFVKARGMTNEKVSNLKDQKTEKFELLKLFFQKRIPLLRCKVILMGDVCFLLEKIKYMNYILS